MLFYNLIRILPLKYISMISNVRNKLFILFKRSYVTLFLIKYLLYYIFLLQSTIKLHIFKLYGKNCFLFLESSISFN